MNKFKSLIHFIVALLVFSPYWLVAQDNKKLRLIVLTDVEADPDDTESMIRFLTYSNQWNVEGLIATTSIHQKTRVAPESILKVLAAYRLVQPNLLKHEKGFPGYEQLVPLVKKGLPVYGMLGVGKEKDSEGSESKYWTKIMTSRSGYRFGVVPMY